MEAQARTMTDGLELLLKGGQVAGDDLFERIRSLTARSRSSARVEPRRRKARATCARIVASEAPSPSQPCARACTSTFPSAVASTGPARSGMRSAASASERRASVTYWYSSDVG